LVIIDLLRYQQLLEEKEELEAAFREYRMEVESSDEASAVKEVRMLKNMMKSLEEDLMKETTKNQRMSSKRSQEYRQLMDEVCALHINEFLFHCLFFSPLVGRCQSL
jgi:coiled-coil domain-containing protein 61